MTDGDVPEKHGCPNCGRVHPGVGCSGHAPPVEHRFQPGQTGNPGGRPKGSASIRAALRRSLAAGHESDPDGIGARAVSLAQKYLDAVDTGDRDAIEALDALITQVEGKPTEYVERTNVKRFEVNMQPRRGATEPPA